MRLLDEACRQPPVVPPWDSSEEAQPRETSQVQVFCSFSHLGMVLAPCLKQPGHLTSLQYNPCQRFLGSRVPDAVRPSLVLHPACSGWENGARSVNPALPSRVKLCSHPWPLTAKPEPSLVLLWEEGHQFNCTGAMPAL